MFLREREEFTMVHNTKYASNVFSRNALVILLGIQRARERVWVSTSRSYLHALKASSIIFLDSGLYNWLRFQCVAHISDELVESGAITEAEKEYDCFGKRAE